MMDDELSISEKIKLIRGKHDMNQAQFADYIGVNRATVSSWETSKSVPSPQIIYKMSNMYGISAGKLFHSKIKPKRSCKKMKKYREIDSNEKVSIRIDTLIRAKRLSTEDIVNYVGISGTTLTTYRHGKAVPRKDNLKKLSRLLNVSPYLILYGLNSKPTNALPLKDMGNRYSTDISQIKRNKNYRDNKQKSSQKKLKIREFESKILEQQANLQAMIGELSKLKE